MTHSQQLPLQVLCDGLQMLIKIILSISEEFHKYYACISTGEGVWKCDSENSFFQLLDPTVQKKNIHTFSGEIFL